MSEPVILFSIILIVFLSILNWVLHMLYHWYWRLDWIIWISLYFLYELLLEVLVFLEVIVKQTYYTYKRPANNISRSTC